ncbi:MAG: hypothetical protein JJ868_02155 [Shimia sp.]|uniref:hypothetical protein n=1 Tax=Shimia sp. TaxID=1954381 RepID=UPI001B0F89D8|nr:hypothetical protein [Shimia sp.]MBO6896151.1 hypothetical protein [Shimia sp.]
MAKRRTREDLRSEFLGLLKIWPNVRSFYFQQGLNAGLSRLDDDLPSAEELLNSFDNGPGTASEHLSGLKGTLQQMAVGFSNGLRHGEQTAQDFLAHYEAASGRSFFTDMGAPSLLIDAILAKGSVADEREYSLLKMSLDDDLLEVEPNLVDQVNLMLTEFERNVSTR